MHWKQSVIWRHHLQASIFSIIMTLFQGSTWSDSYVIHSFTLCLFHNTCCNHPLQQAVCDWFEKNWRVCLFKKNHCNPALLKMPIYFIELIALIFFWKVLCKILTGKLPPVKLPPRKIAPNKSPPWVRVRVWVRVGGGAAIFQGTIFHILC